MTIDILALARECGITADSPWGDEFMCTASSAAIAAFGNAIIERCAAVCDERAMADALIGKLRAIQARLNKGPDDWDGNHAQMEASLRECRYDLADLLPEIVAALERDAQDAARYRGLRDVGDHTFTPMVQRGPHYSTQQIDLRIDAAKERT